MIWVACCKRLLRHCRLAFRDILISCIPKGMALVGSFFYYAHFRD